MSSTVKGKDIKLSKKYKLVNQIPQDNVKVAPKNKKIIKKNKPLKTPETPETQATADTQKL